METTIDLLDAFFDEWWQLWPPGRKIGKADARASYKKAVKRIAKERDGSLLLAAEFLLDRLGVFSKTPKCLGDYCPHPATWLNQGRYDDDEEAWNRGRQHGAIQSVGDQARVRQADRVWPE